MRSYNMEEAAAVNGLPLEEKSEIWLRNPWLQVRRPFQMIGNLYYVGLDWVGAGGAGGAGGTNSAVGTVCKNGVSGAIGIDCGDVVFRPVHCPGHTPGTTSLFFDIPYEGTHLTCAIHGGLGGAILTRKKLEENRLPLDLQKRYVDSIDRIMDIHVDVLLPSHRKHAVDQDIFEIADADDGSGRGFIDPAAWKRMLQEKRQIVADMMARGE